MAETLVERIWAWLHETFPERQVYIRSDGRVQFFTFAPVLQATLAAISLVFLGWVAFATVNVIFKDRIIAAKDHRYQQMQSAYENRVADLQLSYDEVNGALVSAEDKFRGEVDQLQVKQNTIMHFLDRKQQADAALMGNGAPGVAVGKTENTSANDSVGGPAPTARGGSDADSDIGGASELSVSPQPVKPQPRTAKPQQHTGFLDLGGAVGRIAGALFGNRKRAPDVAQASFARHPVLKRLAAQTEQVHRLGTTETELLTGAQGEMSKGIAEIRAVLHRTGISPDRFEQRVEGAGGVGGPDISFDNVRIEGISDAAFQKAYLNAYAVLNQLNQLLAGMRHVPLTTPVSGPEFERSSGFGPRVDPFTGRYAFHPGLDYSGPWGAIVHSTAPGIVVWAGGKGTYGNMVEIDHGYGIHTRYGHLSSILVRAGAKVGKSAPIGKLGSTGRSTGPHVHYEVWYDDVVRNPRNFIEAGRYVLKQ